MTVTIITLGDEQLKAKLLSHLHPGSRPLVLMEFGSHLYGTATEQSDHDYKGVFLPPVGELLLGEVKHNIHVGTKKGEGKNSPDDVDVEWFSLHEFIRLALEGQTVALDMLHARAENWMLVSTEWVNLHERRHGFYSRNTKAFVGYARRQAAKYGVKGSRLSSARDVLAMMEHALAHNEAAKVDLLRTNPRIATLEHVHVTGEYLEVCGRKLQWNARLSMYVDGMRRFVATYGDRARQAEQNQGIDWKAMSHALRAAFQLQAMFRDGDYRYPLPETNLLKMVKAGQLAYADVASRLEQAMERCEIMAAQSTLPDKPNSEQWRLWLQIRIASWLQSTMGRWFMDQDLHTVGEGGIR